MKRLLILSDEVLPTHSSIKQLKLEGYETIFKTINKDVEKYLSKNKDIDVIVFDLKNLNKDVEYFLRNTKVIRPEIQIVILSENCDQEKLSLLDAFICLQKPIETRRLIEELEKAGSKAKFYISEKSKKTEKPLKTKILQLSLALAFGIFIYSLPTPEGLSQEGHRFLAFLVFIIILWITEAIPIGVTALLVGSGSLFFQIQKPESAWMPYASPAVMFVMMITMFGVIINEVGLTNRILFGVLKLVGRKLIPFSLFLCIVSSMLSSIFHDATITIIFLFSMIPVFTKLNISPHNSNNFSKFFTILIPLSASAGGYGTILGGGRNAIAVDFIEKHYGIQISFFEYLTCQLPIVIFISLATWSICYLIFRPKLKELPDDFHSTKLPPISREEKGVAIIFAIAFIFWSIGDLTKLHVSVVAALAIIVICGFGFVNFKKIIEKFAWDVWFVFGAGVVLGTAMLDTGAGKWLAEQFSPYLFGQAKIVQLFGISIFASFISSFMSDSAATALCLPIMLPLAESLGLSVKHVTLLLPAATSFVWFVIGCPPTIIAYSTGYFSQIDFVKVSVTWAFVSVLIYVLIINFYWPFIGF